MITSLASTFKEFQALLGQRLLSGIYTTEDAVRYTFFAALLRQAVDPKMVAMEYPHPTTRNARVDTVVLDE